MRLQDTVVIVTGSARGIGRVYAHGFAREGARVVVADILDPSQTVQEIQKTGGQAFGQRVDVSRADSAREMAEAARQRWGRIDVLVNNAALAADLPLRPFTEIPEEEWDRVMAVNVKGLWQTAKAVFPVMRAQGEGSIINIASNTIFKGATGFPHYVASKGAIVALTRSLAREMGEFGIRVNAVAPDYIPNEKNLQKYPQKDVDIIQSRIFKRRQVPEDMVGTVLFLALKESEFMTGQLLVVNGGSFFY